MQWRLNFVDNDSGFYLTALVVMLSFLLVWLAQTTLFWRLGNRFAPGRWTDYFLPGYGAYLLCRAVGVTPWCALGLWFFPTTLFFLLYIGGAAAERLGKSFWLYGALSACGGLGLALLAGGRAADGRLVNASHPLYTAPPTQPVPELVFLTGDLAGSTALVPSAGLVIGSDPKRAQLVCAAPGVNNLHVRITPDSEQPSTVVVEDLSSSQGTYYWCKQERDWRRLIWPMRFHLYQMIRLRIGAAGCELEIHPH